MDMPMLLRPLPAALAAGKYQVMGFYITICSRTPVHECEYLKGPAVAGPHGRIIPDHGPGPGPEFDGLEGIQLGGSANTDQSSGHSCPRLVWTPVFNFIRADPRVAPAIGSCCAETVGAAEVVLGDG